MNIDKVRKIIKDSKDTSNPYSSYVRKILTILDNIEKCENYEDLQGKGIRVIKYVSFENLLKELFMRGGSESENTLNSATLEGIASILYEMNTYSDEVNWGPLTTIKWNKDGQNYSIGKLFEVLSNAKKNIELGLAPDTQYGIRINTAGQMLLKVLPEFEYFAMRFCGNMPSLFDDLSMTKIGGRWVAEIIIDNVMFKAIKCINTIIHRDKQYVSNYGNYEPRCSYLASHTKWLYKAKYHPCRILQQHINHLMRYENFVKELPLDVNGFKDTNVRDEFVSMIDKKVKLYNEIIIQLKETHREFFTKQSEIK